MNLSSDNPLVSVIILCYNQAGLISRAISSVLNQTYPNVQLVLVDDCSTDHSKAVIEEWKRKYPERIKTYFQQVNVGHPANMNTGYRLCEGELITFCDGDDWYFPQKIEQEVNYLKQHPEHDVVYSNFDYYSIDGRFIKHWATDASSIPVGDIFLSLLSLAYPYRSHLRYEMTSKKIIEETGYYDERIPIWVDWDFRLRLAAKYKFGYCHQVGSAYTHNPDGLTNVVKQETILQYLKFVIDKNRHLLNGYPEKEAAHAIRKINLSVKKLELAVNIQKGRPSFRKTVQFLYHYPSQLGDVRFVISSCLGRGVMESISRLKKKFVKATGR